MTWGSEYSVVGRFWISWAAVGRRRPTVDRDRVSWIRARVDSTCQPPTSPVARQTKDLLHDARQTKDLTSDARQDLLHDDRQTGALLSPLIDPQTMGAVDAPMDLPVHSTGTPLQAMTNNE